MAKGKECLDNYLDMGKLKENTQNNINSDQLLSATLALFHSFVYQLTEHAICTITCTQYVAH